MITDQITGRGLTFPIQLTDGSVKPIGGYELIRSCIYNILVHDLGKRYFQRDFGVGLEKYLSEPNDLITERSLLYHLRNQLPKWDQRVTVDSVVVNREPNNYDDFEIIVYVSLTGTDQTEAMVFPINNAVI